MFRRLLLGTSAIALSLAVATAQQPPSPVDNMIEQLSPSTASGSPAVISVKAATETEIVSRLAGSNPAAWEARRRPLSCPP